MPDWLSYLQRFRCYIGRGPQDLSDLVYVWQNLWNLDYWRMMKQWVGFLKLSLVLKCWTCCLNIFGESHPKCFYYKHNSKGIMARCQEVLSMAFSKTVRHNDKQSTANAVSESERDLQSAPQSVFRICLNSLFCYQGSESDPSATGLKSSFSKWNLILSLGDRLF